MEPNSNPNEDKKTYQDLLMELLNLRGRDPEKFMDKLYEALFGPYSNTINAEGSVEQKISALQVMIQHFEQKEEYEKCAKLKTLADSLHEQ